MATRRRFHEINDERMEPMQREEERDTGSERDRKWCSGSFMHLDTIPRYRDLLRLLARSRAAKYYFEPTRRGDTSSERVVEACRYIMCSRVQTRARRNVTIIFSLEIEATYDALASTCVVRVCHEREFFIFKKRKEKKEERQFAREDGTCGSYRFVCAIKRLIKTYCEYVTPRDYSHSMFRLIRLPHTSNGSRFNKQKVILIYGNYLKVFSFHPRMRFLIPSTD